jgi:hypothetical protein
MGVRLGRQREEGVGRPTINPRKDQDPGSLLDSSMLDNHIAIHLRPVRLMVM